MMKAGMSALSWIVTTYRYRLWHQRSSVCKVVESPTASQSRSQQQLGVRTAVWQLRFFGNRVWWQQ